MLIFNYFQILTMGYSNIDILEHSNISLYWPVSPYISMVHVPICSCLSLFTSGYPYIPWNSIILEDTFTVYPFPLLKHINTYLTLINYPEFPYIPPKFSFISLYSPDFPVFPIFSCIPLYSPECPCLSLHVPVCLCMSLYS